MKRTLGLVGMVLLFLAVGVIVSAALTRRDQVVPKAPVVSQPTGLLHLQTVQDAVLARRQGLENAWTIKALQDNVALLLRDQLALLRRLEAVELLVAEGAIMRRAEK